MNEHKGAAGCGRGAWIEGPATVCQCPLLLMPRAFSIFSSAQLDKAQTLERRVLVPGARVSVGQYRCAQDGYSLFSLRALEKYPESWCWLLTQDEGTAPGQQSSEAEHAGAGVPSWFSSTGSGY